MTKLTDEQRVEYEKRNKRIEAAARAGVNYTDLAARFGVNRHAGYLLAARARYCERWARSQSIEPAAD